VADRDGAASEVEGIAISVLEDGEQSGIAGQPTSSVASDGDTGRLQDIAGIRRSV
jgi:hypothetical protein